MDDLISRQAAYETLTDYYHHRTDIQHNALREALNKVPSAVRHGKWLEHKDYPGLAYLCSECNWFTTDRSFYCPHCGARMDGEQHE